jgi:hypothetical protein
MKKAVLVILISGFSGMAQAKSLPQKVEDSFSCGSQWMREVKHVSMNQSINLNYLREFTIGGPELGLFVASMSNCLGRKHDKIGSVQPILSLPGASILDLMNDFTAIIE